MAKENITSRYSRVKDRPRLYTDTSRRNETCVDRCCFHFDENVFVCRPSFISERELMFAICYRPSVCLSSVAFVRPTQAVQIFGNISMALGTLAIH